MELHEKGSIGDLAYYRIETAKSDLKAATILMREEEYRGEEQITGLIMQFIMPYPLSMH